ncbi:hypothetical protein GPOL_c31710 [Gordonia polyisoprenivorans VH2]|uniref:Uncharacterized protein n=1 Tax=Gordonia polyisoprenivorans (strain DSM 44266 / VH2) TaxID=1112204 RepID=H6MWI1_GORPV|nr:hypothetical protein GPOL_c31710 [Gordonia polyisoprenivorans VH2]
MTEQVGTQQVVGRGDQQRPSFGTPITQRHPGPSGRVRHRLTVRRVARSRKVWSQV